MAVSPSRRLFFRTHPVLHTIMESVYSLSSGRKYKHTHAHIYTRIALTVLRKENSSSSIASFTRASARLTIIYSFNQIQNTKPHQNPPTPHMTMPPLPVYILIALFACILFSIFGLGLLHILETMTRKAGRAREKDFRAGGAMAGSHGCSCQHGFGTESVHCDDGRCCMRQGLRVLAEW